MVQRISHKAVAMLVWCIVGLLMTTFAPEVQAKSVGSADNELEGLEDTVVPLGDEPLITPARRMRRTPFALTEIRERLSRNTRAVPEHMRSQEVYQRMRAVLALLRMVVGRAPQVEILQFMNWDRTIHVDQLFYTVPTTIFEVRRVIRAAAMLGLRCRATGVAHSRSPLYVDEGDVLMDVRQLTRHDGPRMELHQPTTERNYQTLTAVTGVILNELNVFMDDHGVTMLSQPLNDVETLGGMVSAATHGATWSAPAVSGYVVELRLMDSAGRLRRFSQERHPEIMKAARCSLGMFGILYDITIRVYPTFKVKVQNQFVPVELIYNSTLLKETVTGNFLTEISWYPFNSVTDSEAKDFQRTGVVPPAWNAKRDVLWVRSVRPVTEQEAAGQQMSGPVYLPTNGSMSGGDVEGILRGRSALELARRVPSVVYQHVVNAFPVILPPRWGSETNSAFMVNVDNDFHRAAAALQFMVERAESQIKANGTTPLNAFLPRFMMNTDCFLCPGNSDITMPDDNNRTLVVDFLSPPDQSGYYAAAQEFVEHFKDQKVRPHWGKRHEYVPGIMDIIRQSYGPLIPEFLRMRKMARVDPCDMFTNSYLLAIFGRNTDWYCPQ